MMYCCFLSCLADLFGLRQLYINVHVYISLRRDINKFENPDELNVEREDARQHISFGFGIHRCLGNRLADLQLKILWEEILKRFSFIETVGETKYLNSSFIRGITELPVIVHRK